MRLQASARMRLACDYYNHINIICYSKMRDTSHESMTKPSSPTPKLRLMRPGDFHACVQLWRRCEGVVLRDWEDPDTLCTRTRILASPGGNLARRRGRLHDDAPPVANRVTEHAGVHSSAIHAYSLGVNMRKFIAQDRRGDCGQASQGPGGRKPTLRINVQALGRAPHHALGSGCTAEKRNGLAPQRC